MVQLKFHSRFLAMWCLSNTRLLKLQFIMRFIHYIYKYSYLLLVLVPVILPSYPTREAKLQIGMTLVCRLPTNRMWMHVIKPANMPLTLVYIRAHYSSQAWLMRQVNVQGWTKVSVYSYHFQDGCWQHWLAGKKNLINCTSILSHRRDRPGRLHGKH